MGKLNLSPVSDRIAFRKLAMGSWSTVGDPSTYAYLEIDMTNALNYIRRYNDQHDLHATPTHFTGMAVSRVFKERPEINGMIRGSRIYLRDSVSIFFLVNIPGKDDGKADLSGCTLHNVEDKSMGEIVQSIQEKVERTRKKKSAIAGVIKRLNFFPWFLSKYLLKLISFLNYGLNLNLTWLGVPKDPFGSVMITNVGTLGIDNAWAPLTPHSRSPIIITLGAVKNRPWVVDNQVTVRPIMTVGATFDHRFMDGSHAAAMAKIFRDCFEHPEKHFGRVEEDELAAKRQQRDREQDEPRIYAEAS